MTNSFKLYFSVGSSASQSMDIGDDNARTEPTEAEIGQTAGIVAIIFISLVGSLILLPDLATLIHWLVSKRRRLTKSRFHQ